MYKPVHSISKTLFIWDILRIFVPVARDGRLKGWKLSAAPGGDRLYSWLHWHLTALLLSPLSIVPVSLIPTESCRFASSRFWAQMTAAWLWGGKCHWKYISFHFHFYTALEWKCQEILLVMSITFCGVCVTCPRRGGGRARGRGRVSWSGGTREPAAAGTLERGLNSDLNTALITFLWNFSTNHTILFAVCLSIIEFQSASAEKMKSNYKMLKTHTCTLHTQVNKLRLIKYHLKTWGRDFRLVIRFAGML